MATPWVNIDGHNTLVWDISYPPGADDLNWGPALTAALIWLVAARPRQGTAYAAGLLILVTAVMVGRLVATMPQYAQLGPGPTCTGLGLILAVFVIGPIAWRGWPPGL